MAALTLTAAAAGAPAALAAVPQPGLNAQYFDYTNLSGPLAQRIDRQIDFNWNLNEPVPGTGSDYSVRWTGSVTPPHSETYTFFTRSDDGVRLWIDGKLVIDDWNLHAALERSGQIHLEAGRPHSLRLEYFNALKHGSVRLDWRSPGLNREVVPTSALTTGYSPVEVPAHGGVTAVVQPAGSAFEPMVPRPGLAPGPGDPAIVSHGGPLQPPAPPVAAATFNAEPEGGTVLVRRPADGQLLPLEQGASLPVGTRIDAREGIVDIQTAPADGVDRLTQDAHFEGGMFRVGQTLRRGKVVTIDLIHGQFKEVCGRMTKAERRAMTRRKARGAAVARAAGAKRKRSRRVLRRLWGSGKGRFRTRGRHAAATVRGTSWSIADRCGDTAVRVHSGVVDVEELATGRTVTLRSGQRYAARP